MSCTVVTAPLSAVTDIRTDNYIVVSGNRTTFIFRPQVGETYWQPKGRDHRQMVVIGSSAENSALLSESLCKGSICSISGLYCLT